MASSHSISSSRASTDARGVTQYVRSGDGDIAYQVVGSGTVDILVVNEKLVPLEALHDNVFTASFLRRLTEWGRVILFDRSGVGLSDAIAPEGGLHLANWVDDAVTVLDAVGSERAAVFSFGPSAGLIAIRLAADHPERVSFLSLYDAIARYRWAQDYPWGVSAAADDAIVERTRNDWGTTRYDDPHGRLSATAARHPGFAEWAVTWLRRGAGPGTHASHMQVLRDGDVRDALASISCPTIVINHADTEDGRFLAEHIDRARYVELVDSCHLLFSPELDAVMAATSKILNMSAIEPARHRFLTTLLFTDIVGSTANVARVGDRRWGFELDIHYDMVRRNIARFDGREIKTMGDGFISVFDGPTRAVQCALAICHESASRQIGVRAGVHTGEVERRGDDVLGVSVHVAQRVCGVAAAGQVLATQSVIDLVSGSNLRFRDLGSHHLRGLDGR